MVNPGENIFTLEDGQDELTGVAPKDKRRIIYPPAVGTLGTPAYAARASI